MSLDLEATAAVRRRMQRTARNDNAFERTVRSLLHAQGLRYRIHFPLPGLKRMTCDIAFPKLKIAVFLDGCFWHGCEIHPPAVKKNINFWLEKIERNRTRDALATAHLEEANWRVLRFWEHETAEDIAETIFSAVSAARGTSPDLRGPLKDVERPSC
ncbi:very short patch repair endonuclease [Rhizobium ruizarguesonis]|uniref:very short patch repair endonuclease n=1 Tax=Rhizobium ruizarguesonis TaxID=2081791 RepID=UPI00103231F5|nr:very short patch repair endonuclease [Rhizobium ruizarguesonis]TBA20986.1 very short patch repair endonuclease [Rhizobium ruizarguesonis]